MKDGIRKTTLYELKDEWDFVYTGKFNYWAVKSGREAQNVHVYPSATRTIALTRVWFILETQDFVIHEK